jgi:hypothetical protein
MAERQFEISKRAFIRKCSMAILLGSVISVWMFIIWDYFSMIRDQGYYSAPTSILEMQLLCIPIFGYQLPAYLVSGLICISLVKRGWVKSAIVAYLGAGLSGWIISTLLMFVSGTDYTLDAMVGALGIELPSLLMYLVFLFPKSAE